MELVVLSCDEVIFFSVNYMGGGELFLYPIGSVGGVVFFVPEDQFAPPLLRSWIHLSGGWRMNGYQCAGFPPVAQTERLSWRGISCHLVQWPHVVFAIPVHDLCLNILLYFHMVYVLKLCLSLCVRWTHMRWFNSTGQTESDLEAPGLPDWL